MQSWSLTLAAALLALCIGGAAAAPPAEVDDDLPMAELELLTEVYSRIKRDYVDEVEDADLFRAAIRGMLSELDAHSSYLDERELEQLREGTRGEFGGVGLELSRQDGEIRVVAPIDDTPATRAGLQAGDVLLRIDGEPVRGNSLNDVVQRLRGEPGTAVEVTIRRTDEEGRTRTFELERDTIQVESVRARMLEPGYGYVRISQFQERTASDLYPALDRLLDEAGGGLHGLILDLRNNPGGVLDPAVAVADAFLTEGRIVYTEGRMPQARMSFEATPVDRARGAPMVVLINRGSASGSEIVAGALQDHRRAVVMGRASFGKGSVQSVMPLGGAAMKLTTARYYTPQGRSIQDEGIQPDIVVEELRLAEAAEREAEVVPDTPADADDAEQAAELAQDDYVLSEALNLLKGLRVFEGR
ncbi:S41 family peptidase [Halorhodospira sp. 9621]|uniref:S41 family peptidase n=1 Tax=Halorhodospira TaxID=85108 RepID=UPI001912EDF9|nr:MULTISPECIES: S41 family peptidase [Halorhodospira]MBK5943565.1 peptidase S41 [Halorhodospira halophila]MCG5527096.1 S41 family peptidase [Halorhodospira halophila]MCG5534279.1 S41 family peptidase [Halorhodospira sp. 9621]MCG5538802.1 S41 family peptidase [Halorhodospira sp. 9622]MCG5544592.1 S41 family peptidase [Halorhodospira sp. 9628]